VSYHPNSEQVGVAWIGGISGFVAGMVGTDLPSADNATFAASGFIQVKAVAGQANIYTPLRQPLIQADCWAVNSASGRPPWNRAWHLANTVWAASLDHPNVPREVTTPDAYLGARVLSVWPQAEPRVVPADLGSYARVTVELNISWAELPT
jgi:hypothetical protein